MASKSKTIRQKIPLSKIHDLQGLKVTKENEKNYSNLISNIITYGIQDPLILRLREDGEFELLSGYRRRRAAEIAKYKEVPALVYEMTVEEAKDYVVSHKTQPDIPVPGRLLSADELEKDKKTEKEKSTAKAAAPERKAEAGKAGKPKESKASKPSAKEKESKPEGPAAMGPNGTGITKVLDSRLSAPGAKELESLPLPEENEAYSVILHPGYLEKADYNNFSIDRESDDFKELYKSIENFGVREPVIATPGENGKLQIVSGQRRHLIAAELNYPVPTIIQRLDPDDARILVADSNLHREKISSYDLSRALRMKADSMKKRVGRRKLGVKSEIGVDTTAELAKEMGMSPAKLNRILKLSEASKEICNLVDDGTISISIAYNIAFLDTNSQEEVARLINLGYKASYENTNTLKTVAKTEPITEEKMRAILDGEYPPRAAAEPSVTADNAKVSPVMPEAPEPEAAAFKTVSTEPDRAIAESKPAKEPERAEAVPTKAVPVSSVMHEPPAGQDSSAPEKVPEYDTKVVLRGERLRRYFPDSSMTPRQIEESIYSALEERRQRQEKMKQKNEMLNGERNR